MALAWPNHVHHARAHAWFAEGGRKGWATCSITETGFVRVSSNERVVPEARSPVVALDVLRRIRDVRGHEFWVDDVSPTDARSTPFARAVGYRQVTDAHLLSLAMRRGGKVATFDRGLVDLVPEGVQQPVEIIT